ncbi:MAG: ABC transporter permease [Bacteroidota bacterium]
MLRNYLKIALRNIWKSRTASTINILGLALGLACCFMIVIYVQHERSYDQFHPDLERVFRLDYELVLDETMTFARIPPTVAAELPAYFPEIEKAGRMYPREISVQVVNTGQQLEIRNTYFTDSTITSILGFDFLYGNARDALREPFSVVLSASTAERLFGRQDVLGERLQLADFDQFLVKGVVQDWPDQAHLDIDMLVHYDNMVEVEPENAREIVSSVLANNWIASHSYTYVKLNRGATAEKVDARTKSFILNKGDERFREKQSFFLTPVRDIHLESQANTQAKSPADPALLRLFLAIGIITVLIAVFNFINLSTASSLSRAREVGMRKVLGAKRPALLGQFLGESLLLTAFAFAIAMLLVWLALPALASLTGLELQFSFYRDGQLLLLFLLVFLLTGLLAGSYPAFYLSGFKPLAVLQNRSDNANLGGVALRKVLMTAQFVVAIAFISGTAIVFKQMNYLRGRPLGFAKEQVITLPLNSQNNINSVFRPGDANIRQRMNAFDEELLKHPNIKAVTQSVAPPGMGAVSRNVWTDKVLQEDNFFAPVYAVDYDFAEAYELQVVAGREFDLSYGTDHISSFVINEQAVKDLNWDSPEAALDQRLVVEGKEGKVVGVIKDFHFRSMLAAIEPLIMEVNAGSFGYFNVHLKDGDLAGTLAFMEEKWADFFPAKSFEYNFLDETLDQAYEAQDQLGTLIGYFAFLAIFISCFGLFGLAALLTKRRFREIGIRKVLGAQASQILVLLAKDFVWLIGISLCLALPLCWYFITNWMEDFPYRIDFPWWLPLSVGLGVVLLAFLTVSSQTLRAALSNPVEAIRQE